MFDAAIWLDVRKEGRAAFYKAMDVSTRLYAKLRHVQNKHVGRTEQRKTRAVKSC
jgi:hypothetical protein